MRIGITGASGALGSRAARQLLAALDTATADGPREHGGATEDLVRLVVRSPSRLPVDLRERAQSDSEREVTTGSAGPIRVELATASFADAASCRAAFAGLDALLLVSAGESADRVQQHRTAVSAAADAGVGHLVYTSFTGAAADAEFTLARDHGATEDAIRAAAERSGMGWTMLRDDFYLDVLAPWAGEDRTLRGPAGTGRCAFVARDDVADAAAAILRDPGPWNGAVLEMTGGEALTLEEVAQRLTAATGEEHRYVDETLEEARASRAGYGAPDWQVDAWISTYTAIASGSLASVSGDVRRVLGREPRRLEDVLARR